MLIHVKPSYVWLALVISCYTSLGVVRSASVKLGQVMPGSFRLVIGMSG